MSEVQAARFVEDQTSGDDVKIVYEVLGFAVIFEADLSSPIGGPSKITISFDYSVEGVNRAIESDGITIEVTRALPIADARRRIGAYLAKAQAEYLRPLLQALPERIDTDRDLARFAKVYADLVAARDRQPLTHLVKATGQSRNTLSARIRRARESGLLTRPEGNNLGALTDAARALLSDEMEE